MQRMMVLGKFWGWWQRVIVGVITAAVLLPVPALALTWTSPWFITQDQRGGAPAATVAFGDFLGGGFLSIDMGSYATPRTAHSNVSATRTFSIGGTGNFLAIMDSYASSLRQAGLTVIIDVRRVDGGDNIFTAGPLNEQAGRRSRFVSGIRSEIDFLDAGDYQVTIDVRYNKAGRGAWTNVSAHRFTFMDL